MKDTSQVTKVGWNGRSVHTSRRAFTRSSTETRSSLQEALVELAAADVERADPGGAGLEEAVREPAGRGADIEAVLARDVDRERGERMGELLASAGDEARAAG